MAEGIAGTTPQASNAEGGICRTLMLELCDDGKKMVKVTKMLRKNTRLMFPEDIPWALLLDNYLAPPAPPGTYVTWSTTYLVDKADVT